MAKVEVIKKSRKECRCNKCGKTIPVGSKYYKGEINFGPTIRRCETCGLESWEITTSDYKLQVGEIVYRWQENYSKDQSGVDEIISALEDVRDEVQDRLDNIPEQLQEADAGMLLQERIEMLEDAISELENIDEDTIREEKLREFADKFDFDQDDEDEEDRVEYPFTEEDLEDWDRTEAIVADHDEYKDDWIEMVCEVESEIEEAINEALGSLDV